MRVRSFRGILSALPARDQSPPTGGLWSREIPEDARFAGATAAVPSAGVPDDTGADDGVVVVHDRELAPRDSLRGLGKLERETLPGLAYGRGNRRRAVPKLCVACGHGHVQATTSIHLRRRESVAGADDDRVRVRARV